MVFSFRELCSRAPDTNLIAAIPGGRKTKAGASRNPGYQNREPFDSLALAQARLGGSYGLFPRAVQSCS